MADGLKVGLVVAIGAGALFGVITALEGAVAWVVGGINASLLEHFIAGIISIILLIIILLRGSLNREVTLSVLPKSILGGIFVLVAVAAIAFAIPRTGVAVGNLALILGQLFLAAIIDTTGFAGIERIPLSPARILGLLVMGIGIYIILPKKG
jgi:bacterial/archaeal transporter family-2 protein